MQRYQVNYKVLVSLVLGGVLLAGALGGLYLYQSGRNADSLLILAEKAREDGDSIRAARSMLRYIKLREEDLPRIDETVDLLSEIVEDADLEPSERGWALNHFEAIVSQHRNNAELRRRLVDLRMNLRTFKEAAQHLEIMVSDDPKDGEVLSLLTACYLQTQQYDKGLKVGSKVVGFDPRKGEFDEEATPVDPHNVDAYAQLAALLVRTSNEQEEVDAVMQRVVDLNPESSQAYVIRGQYYLTQGDEKKEQGVSDIEKARELDPKNIGALLIRARLFAQDEQYDEALKLVEQGLKEEPGNASLYLAAAQIAQSQGGVEATLEWLQKGADATTGDAQLNVIVTQVEALINTGSLAEAKELIATLAANPRIRKSRIEYLKARVLVSEDKWHAAAVSLARLRPEVSNDIRTNEELNALLALCYTRLEQWERVVDAASRALEVNPKNKMALSFLRTAESRLGRRTDDSGAMGINELVASEMNKPAEKQDWQSVYDRATAISDQMIEEEVMTESGKLLMLAEICIRGNDYNKARSLVKQAIKTDSDNINTWRLACRLTATDPNGGAVKGMKMLDQVVDRFGDKPVLRLDRADMYISLNDENVVKQMLTVADGIEDMPKSSQVLIWKGLATRFESLRAADALETARNKVAELAPSELPNLLDMFLAARAENNDAQMADAQNRILGVVGNKQDPNWLYTEAHRKISLYQRKLEGDEALDEAEQLVKRAQQKRPEWHMLSLLMADLAVQRGDAAGALDSLDRASELGKPTATSLYQHVSLLMQRKRYDDARRQIERAATAFREQLLSRQYAECLLGSRYLGESEKKWEQAVEVARNAGERAQEDGDAQLWLGRFMMRASLSNRLADSTREAARKESGAAFGRAVELLPKSQEAWLAYISYLAQADATARTADDQLTVGTSNINEAREAVRQMQLALDEDTLPLALGAGYEILGRWFDAENVYKLALDADPENLAVKRRLAALYLGNSYPLDDKVAKATPLINEMLRLAAERPEFSSEDNVLWARRTAAKLLAQTGDYQKALDAERLLRSNVVDGELGGEDKLLMAKILATRPEPLSRLKAIQLYENVSQSQELGPADQLTMGQLYFATNQWEECQRLMRELISRNRTFVQARDAYIRMLLTHNEGRDLADAASQHKQLQKYAPTSPSTLELLVRISSKMGREKDVVPTLKDLLSRKENRGNADVIVRVANLLADLDDLDNAEVLLRAAAEKLDPRKNLDLAIFLGNYREIDDALDLLEKAKADFGVTLAVQSANLIFKSQADSLEDRHIARVQGWLDRALREDPESIRLLMQQAELYDAKREPAKCVDLYRDLLKRADLVGMQRAIALNNLAFQLAMSTTDNASFEQAIGYVAEAADILGPQSEILDTRAVVLMSLGDYDAAVADMELAVTDNPTASKFYHLAQALMLDQQPQRAVDAWDKAIEMGLSIGDVGIAEREGYRELESKIKRLKVSAGPEETAAAG